jgi:hypothetical protein
MIDGETEIPRALVEPYARGDPIVRSMLKKGLPLTRNCYLMLNYGADLPHPDDWNHEHEAEVPECFRDKNAVKIPSHVRMNRDTD